MTKISKTYTEVFGFLNAANLYLRKHKDKENKLCVSIRSVLKQTGKFIDEYQERLIDEQLNNCSVDEKTKVILKDANGNLQFTVDAQKKVNKFVKDIMNESVQIDQRLRAENDELISSLTAEEKEAFIEIVISKQAEELTKEE